MMDEKKLDRKAKIYAMGVVTALRVARPRGAPWEAVGALLAAAYYNGHQSGESAQIRESYPLLHSHHRPPRRRPPKA